jgi:1-acyl-sn-glycerol-3-phosphate acyltransferase
MRFLRKITRLAILPVWFGIITLLALPGMFAGRRGIRWNGQVSRLWGAGIARILNISIELQGNSPEDFLHGMIVANHYTYLDAIVCSAVFPVRFLPKAEIRYWPVLGWFLSLNRPIWVNRKSPQASAAVAAEVERSLKEGTPVLVYPEGTTSDGTGLLPFKSTAFEAAIRAGMPICPVLLKYDPAENGFSVGWFGGIQLLPHVWKVLEEPGFRVKVALLDAVFPHPGEHRKDLSNRVRQIMLDHYRSM